MWRKMMVASLVQRACSLDGDAKDNGVVHVAGTPRSLYDASKGQARGAAKDALTSPRWSPPFTPRCPKTLAWAKRSSQLGGSQEGRKALRILGVSL